MRLYIFKLLDKVRQIEIAWKSTWLASREDGRFDYELYQIDAFYVELKYEKGERLVSGLKIFVNTDLLEPYFGQIDISKLPF